MRFRAIHLRAILLPLGVALASITAVAWYGLVKIPAQQRYITDRNLRLLKTKSAQIKSKMDNFDASIDHALEFFPGKPSTDSAYLERFQIFVRRFAPGLQVVTDPELEVEKTLARRAGDPPRVVVQLYEGKYVLFLGYGHDGAKIVAKTDLEQTLAPFLSTGTEFDALLLVSRDGRVIVQRSSSGLELAHVDSLRDSSRPAPPPAATGPRAEPAALFESLRKSTSIANVTLGSAEYQMYVQPVQLSLNAGEARDWPLSSPAIDPPGGDVPEEWALCGFVRADHFRAASSSVSYTYLLWFGVALLTVCLATPLLKLHLLSASERLHGGDAVLVAATTFLVTALLALCAIDAYYFRFMVNVAVDDTLKNVATSLRGHFNDETKAIVAQLEQFKKEEIWRDVLDYKSEGLSSYRAGLKSLKPNESPTTIRREGLKGYKCVDGRACRNNILANGLEHFGYPFFDLVVFDDQSGWQRIKWSARGVTPFINIREARLPYYAQLKSARLLLEAGEPTPTGGVGVMQSPNTGEIQTVFWQAFAPLESPRGEADLIGMTISTRLISMVNPVLPAHVQFAVVDDSGRVMFHSDPTRRLHENFFLECEDDPELRAAASGRRSMPLAASYLGRSYRMYASPLDLSQENLTSLADPRWTLFVLQDNAVAETLNLETLAAAVGLFGLYGSALAVAWVVLNWLGRGRISKWFWPNESAGGTYRTVTLLNGVLTVVFLVWVARLEPLPLLVTTASLAVGAVGATFLLVTRPHTARPPARSWRRAFDMARVSYLLIVAAVPAIACFQVAYDFESALLTRSGQVAVAEQLEARDGDIKSHVDRRLLCNAATAPETCDRVVAGFIDRRTWPADSARRGTTDRHAIPWDMSAPDVVWNEARVSTRAATATRLDAFLARMHGAYNDVAAEMTAVLPDSAVVATATHRWRHWPETEDTTTVRLARASGEKPTTTLTSTVARAVPTAAWWLIVAGLAGVLYALMRIVVAPLYVFALCGRRGLWPAEIAADASSSVLLIGPPGAGKTRRLAGVESIRVFDMRTQAFYERRPAARPVAVERRSDAYATAGAVSVFAWSEPSEPAAQAAADTAKPIDWLDSPDLPADPTVPIGIDHLEHSLDNREDRMRTLRFLEDLIYRHKRAVWIAAAREPIGQLRELTDAGPDTAEMARWIRVLQPFREARVSLADRDLSIAGDAEDAASAVAPYYRSVWASCSKAEQLALRQLAEEGVVNPNNDPVVSHLMRSGLVHRTSTFRLMSDTFGRFVLQALSPDEISEREHADVTLPWASITTAMLTVALGLGALLLLTSQQLVDAWVGYVPALAPAVPTVMKLLTSGRRDGKPGTLTA